MLGVCLGSQLLAAALGARVYASGRKEIGWYPRRPDGDAAAHDPLLHGAPRSSSRCTGTATCSICRPAPCVWRRRRLTEHQAFRYGEDVYALLFHMEVDPPQLEAMSTAFADEIAAAGVSPESMRSGAAQHLGTLQGIGATVFDRFAESV